MVLRVNGIDLEKYPPVAISMLIAQTARSLCNEKAVGVTQGHEELRTFVERQLSLLKASAPAPRRTRLARARPGAGGVDDGISRCAELSGTFVGPRVPTLQRIDVTILIDRSNYGRMADAGCGRASPASRSSEVQ